MAELRHESTRKDRTKSEVSLWSGDLMKSLRQSDGTGQQRTIAELRAAADHSSEDDKAGYSAR